MWNSPFDVRSPARTLKSSAKDHLAPKRKSLAVPKQELMSENGMWHAANVFRNQDLGWGLPISVRKYLLCLKHSYFHFMAAGILTEPWQGRSWQWPGKQDCTGHVACSWCVVCDPPLGEWKSTEKQLAAIVTQISRLSHCHLMLSLLWSIARHLCKRCCVTCHTYFVS